MINSIKSTLKRLFPLPARSANLYYSELLAKLDAQQNSLFETRSKISELESTVSKIETSLSQNLSHLQQIEHKMLRIQPHPRLSYFVLNILDHCNLKCQGCDHFSSIAEERFVTLQSIENDLTQMSFLTKGAVTRIGIMGGEPLLHPDLQSILKAARNAFPKTLLELVTNGILLMQQKDDFWETCRTYDINIVVTKYPLNLDYSGMEAVAKERNVTLRYYGITGDAIKTSNKMPLDLNGRQHPVSSFWNCFHVNQCPLLMEGKLYPCTISPNITHFNKFFGKNLELESKDYLDIYTATNDSELLTFLCTPKPFCRYCRTTERTDNIKWERSKQDINEWV